MSIHIKSLVGAVLISLFLWTGIISGAIWYVGDGIDPVLTASTD